MPNRIHASAELVVDVLVIGGAVSLNVGAFLLAAWVGFVAAGVTGIVAGGLLYWWPRRSRQ